MSVTHTFKNKSSKRNAKNPTDGAVQSICPILLIFTKWDKQFTSPAYLTR